MKAPQAPDPLATATSQSQMNRDTAMTNFLMNAVNQVTPYGSLTYKQTGSTFQPSKTGDQYWFNKNTNQYLNYDPFAKSRTTGSTGDTATQNAFTRARNSGGAPAGTGGGMAGITNSTRPGTTGGKTDFGKPEDWTQVQGFNTPTFTAYQELSPEQKRLYDLTTEMGINLGELGVSQSKRLQGLMGQDFKLPGGAMPTLNLPKGAMPTLDTNFGAMPTLNLDNEAVESRLMELGRKRLDPALDQRRKSTEQDLYNRGVRMGSEAYGNSMRGVTEGENDAYNQLLLSGRNQAVNEAMSKYGADMQGRGQLMNERLAGYNSQMQGRNQSINEAIQGYNSAMQNRNQLNNEYLTNRTGPINEILGLAGGSQVQQPNFVNTPGTQLSPVDYTGLVNQKYQADMNAYGSGMSGMFGLGSTLLGGLMKFSDERLKTDKHKMGETPDGIGVYQYRMKGSPMMEMGVMAQEVKRKKPEAVARHPSGYMMVDYSRV
ncbi:tail fiber domain-containing protein [Shinella sp.]|uniref:tail fiber domain-containing protein n=1 Tax=Shinella sp. TaxID=1870904 RepID=UPI003D2C9A79